MRYLSWQLLDFDSILTKFFSFILDIFGSLVRLLLPTATRVQQGVGKPSTQKATFLEGSESREEERKTYTKKTHFLVMTHISYHPTGTTTALASHEGLIFRARVIDYRTLWESLKLLLQG
jgi:hypothetical protein